MQPFKLQASLSVEVSLTAHLEDLNPFMAITMPCSTNSPTASPSLLSLNKARRMLYAWILPSKHSPLATLSRDLSALARFGPAAAFVGKVACSVATMA